MDSGGSEGGGGGGRDECTLASLVEEASAMHEGIGSLAAGHLETAPADCDWVEAGDACEEICTPKRSEAQRGRDGQQGGASLIRALDALVADPVEGQRIRIALLAHAAQRPTVALGAARGARGDAATAAIEAERARERGRAAVVRPEKARPHVQDGLVVAVDAFGWARHAARLARPPVERTRGARSARSRPEVAVERANGGGPVRAGGAVDASVLGGDLAGGLVIGGVAEVGAAPLGSPPGCRGRRLARRAQGARRRRRLRRRWGGRRRQRWRRGWWRGLRRQGRHRRRRWRRQRRRGWRSRGWRPQRRWRQRWWPRRWRW